MKTDTIKICDFLVYPGRNIYSHRPMMKIIVDIGEYSEIPTKDIEGFNERLLNAFPGLKKNCCGLGYEGGFLEKLNSGTYLGHVLEHVILEMQYMLGYDVRYGKTRLFRDPSVYYLVYEFVNEVCGLECGKAAVFILNYFINGEDLDIEEFLEYLKKVSLDAELGPSTQAIVNETKKRGIPITRIGNESLVQLGYGKHSRIIESTLIDSTSCIAADISCNKQLTKSILNEHHIPVPYGKVVYSDITAVLVARQIGYPVVLKPFDGNQGKGVFLNLNSDAETRAAFKEAVKYSNGIIIENFVTGRDYRILVVGDKVIAVAERLPAMVTGDGIHSVKELVEIINQDENRGEQHEKPLTKIRLDSVSITVLKKNKMTVDSIPQEGQIVPLRTNGNLSTGGTAIDCTDIIHPDNANLAVLAAKAIGIDIAGIDVVTQDISKSLYESEGAVVEVNTAPGIRMHIYPSKGKSRDVAKDIVDFLFPKKEWYQFPIVSVTGTNGKTTTVRLITHVLSLSGRTVGLTSTSGTYIGDICIHKGDHSGPRSARTLLSNKTIDCAVLETARGGIIREGLGYDLADVGIILNIDEDHLGMDGIETLEDLAHVKSLVTESVKDDGYAVFNGEDPMTPYLMNRAKCNKMLFTKDKNKFPKEITPENIQVYLDNGWLHIQDQSENIRVIHVTDIPITCQGKIECNIENAMAAMAALYALHIPTDIIAKGFKTFEINTGRFNLYSLNQFHVMLDYGHNLPGYKQVVKACQGFGYQRLVGIIGMPGDRNDSFIQSVGRFCSTTFDSIYIKEDLDKRGREENEVAALFHQAIVANHYNPSDVSIVLNELEALKEAIANAKAGDLIVVFYEKLEPLKDYLLSMNAKEDFISE